MVGVTAFGPWSEVRAHPMSWSWDPRAVATSISLRGFRIPSLWCWMLSRFPDSDRGKLIFFFTFFFTCSLFGFYLCEAYYGPTSALFPRRISADLLVDEVFLFCFMIVIFNDFWMMPPSFLREIQGFLSYGLDSKCKMILRHQIFPKKYFWGPQNILGP